MQEYLTTKELALLLRIKERKVYDLAASGEVPCSKAMGKLLFPRDEIEAWLNKNSNGLDGAISRVTLPKVFLGSHDPLLEWALKESQCGIATFFDGSNDGLARFANREGLATGLHIYDSATNDWNSTAVKRICAHMPAVLIQWAKRSRGLIVTQERRHDVRNVGDLRGLRVAARQAQSGAQDLLCHLLERAAIPLDDVELTSPARTETDAALMVLEGKADVALGLAALATQCNLAFAPLMEERFDLLVDRRAWFEPSMQQLFALCRSDAFLDHANDMPGYDVSGLGRVYFNGP